MDILTHPCPLEYLSAMSPVSKGSAALRELPELEPSAPAFQERVLHLGHLMGVWTVLENHECPQERQVLVVGFSFQWYVPHPGQRTGLPV